MKRIISWILVAVMVVGMLPMNILAAESEPVETEVVYKLAETIESGKTYVVVADDAFALTNAPATAAVTVVDDAITSEVTDAMLWTFTQIEDVVTFGDTPLPIYYVQDVNGSYIQRTNGGSTATLAVNPDFGSNNGKVRYYGWAYNGTNLYLAATNSDSSSTYNYYISASESGVTAPGNTSAPANASTIKLYEAVAAETPEPNLAWTLVTGELEAGVAYVIVKDDKAMTDEAVLTSVQGYTPDPNKNPPAGYPTDGTMPMLKGVDVTVEDGKITSEVTDSMQWILSTNDYATLNDYSNYSVQSKSGLYLYRTSAYRSGYAEAPLYLGESITDSTKANWFVYNMEDGNKALFLNATNGDGTFKGGDYPYAVNMYGADSFDTHYTGGSANAQTLAANCATCALQFYALTEVTGEPEPPVCEHTNTEVRDVVAATCTEDGYTGDTYCTDCGEKIAEGEAIPALGHDYVEGVCTRCGETDPDYKPDTPVVNVVYVPVDVIEDGHTYVVAGAGKALTSPLGTKEVVVSEDGTISGDQVDGTMLWTYTLVDGILTKGENPLPVYRMQDQDGNYIQRISGGTAGTVAIRGDMNGNETKYRYTSWAYNGEYLYMPAVTSDADNVNHFYLAISNPVSCPGGRPDAAAPDGVDSVKLYEAVAVEPPVPETTVIDFTNPEDASKFELVNGTTEIVEGEGLTIVSTTTCPEPANGQSAVVDGMADTVLVPASGDYTATLEFGFSQGSSRGWFEFFAFFAMQDTDNMAGIRAGDGAMQDFLRVGGEITKETQNTANGTGLKAADTHWLRLVKTGNTVECYASTNGEDFGDVLFTHDITGIEPDQLLIDAYSGMATGYTYTLKTLTIESGAATPPAPACEHTNTEVRDEVAATCTEDGYTGDTYCTDCGEKIAEGEAIPALGHDYVDGVCTRCGETDPDYKPETKEGWILADTIESGKCYIIVAEGGYAMTYDTVVYQDSGDKEGRGVLPVTIENGVITTENLDSAMWIITEDTESPAAYNGATQYSITVADGGILQRGSGSTGTAPIKLTSQEPSNPRYKTWSFAERGDNAYTLYLNTERDSTDYPFRLTLQNNEYFNAPSTGRDEWSTLDTVGTAIRLYTLGEIGDEPITPPTPEDGSVDVVFMSDLHNGVGGYLGLKQMVAELAAESVQPKVVSHGGDYVEDGLGGQPNWQTGVYDVISSTEKGAFPDAAQIYTMGNHDWESGTFGGNSNKEAAFKSIFNFDRTGMNYEDDELAIYQIGAQGETGAGGGGETFTEADIAAFDAWLETMQGSGKAIFLQTHWPAHTSYNFKVRVVGNADKLIDVCNKYGDEMDIVWMWGHNHYEDKMRYVILTPGDELMYEQSTGSTWDNAINPKTKTIKFTYANVGCMNDMWYQHTGSNNTNAANNYRGPSACSSVSVTNNTITFTYNRIQQVDDVWTFSHDANIRIYNHNVTLEHPAVVEVERIDACEHELVKGETVAPTCTEDGYTVYTCSKCGTSVKGDTVPATGHSFEDGVCTVCGEKEPGGDEPTVTTYELATEIEVGAKYIIVSNGYAVKNEETSDSVVADGTSLATVAVTVEDDKITSEVTDDMIWTFEEGTSSIAGDYPGYFITNDGTNLLARSRLQNRSAAALHTNLYTFETYTSYEKGCFWYFEDLDDAGTKSMILIGDINDSGDYIFVLSASAESANAPGWQRSTLEEHKPDGAVKLYKVVEGTGTAAYVPATTISGDKQYLIVADGKLILNNDAQAKPIDITGGVINPADVTPDMLWNFAEVTEAQASNGYDMFYIYADSKAEGSNILQRGSGSSGESSAAIVQVAGAVESGKERWTWWSFVERADGTYTMHANTERDHDSDYAFTINISESAVNCTNSYTAWDDLTTSGSSITLYELGTGSVPACKHTNKEIRNAKEATCTEAGYSGDTYCGDCGKKLATGKTIAALGHDWDEGKVTTEPTCGTAGVKTYTCKREGCTATKTESVPATGKHTWGEWEVTTAATAVAEGEETRTCSVCGATETREIPMLGFEDVQDPETYYYAATYWAAKNGITNGTDETHFDPKGGCTRAEAVTFLWNAAGKPEVAANVTNPFTDVDADRYYYKAVLWAVSKGITTGTTATTFEPNGELDRATFVTFLWRAMGEPEAPATDKFTDVKSTKYYATAVAWAVSEGITAGKTDTTFAPTLKCTRAQVVTFLQRAYDK